MSTFRGRVLGRQECLAVQGLWKTPLQPGIYTPGETCASEDGTVAAPLLRTRLLRGQGERAHLARAGEKLRDRAAQLFLCNDANKFHVWTPHIRQGGTELWQNRHCFCYTIQLLL